MYSTFLLLQRSNSSLGTSSIGGMGDQPPRHGSRQSSRSQSRSRISDTASEISEQDLNDGEYSYNKYKIIFVGI